MAEWKMEDGRVEDGKWKEIRMQANDKRKLEVHSQESSNQTVPGQWLNDNLDQLVQKIQPAYFQAKRWFGSKSRHIKSLAGRDWAIVQEEPTLMALLLLEISFEEGEPELYHLPLVLRPVDKVPDALKKQEQGIIAQVQTPLGELAVYEAFQDDPFCISFYQNIYDALTLPAQSGEFLFVPVMSRLETREVSLVRRISGEQSNTSLIYNEQFILKGFRKLAAGQNPDFEVPFFLTTRTSFEFVPKLAGYIEYRVQGQAEPYSIGVVQDFVENEGNGRADALKQLDEFFEQVGSYLKSSTNPTAQQVKEQAANFARPYALAARRLGEITGLLHNALASDGTQPDFAPQPITPEDTQRWQASITGLIQDVLKSISSQLESYPDELRQRLQEIGKREKDYLALVGSLSELADGGTHKIRYHGDFHLEQVLRTGDDFMLLDFEGEPLRSLSERRAKFCPLKDIAGMLRSFQYATFSGLFKAQEAMPGQAHELEQWAGQWEEVARQAFLEGYGAVTSDQPALARFLPSEQEVLQQVINVFELEKAFYELKYEFNNRPTWVPIPVKGLRRVIGLD